MQYTVCDTSCSQGQQVWEGVRGKGREGRGLLKCFAPLEDPSYHCLYAVKYIGPLPEKAPNPLKAIVPLLLLSALSGNRPGVIQSQAVLMNQMALLQK